MGQSVNLKGITDFRGLVCWLARKHHRGHVHPIAARIGVSPGLVNQWKHGAVRNPTLRSLVKLSRAYDLDLNEVLRITYGKSISGGSGLGTLEDHLQVIYYRQQRLAQMRLIGSWPRDRSRPMGWSIPLDRAA
jgi:transcriptional regulator with XRE-family HTH domain